MRRDLLHVLLATAFVSLPGCALPYYLQAARGQIHLLHQRVPIDELLVDPGTDPTTQQRLELVREIRRFAVEALGLPDNKSYTSYVDLQRDYVVWNVVAAPEFSVDPVTWCFPVAGCVAYRGYFREPAAEAFRQKLVLRGYDTFLGGSAAYSTLGYFADPVLNTMLRDSEADVAGTLFHELAHQRLYVKGDTELSESFASAVEQYGVEAWLASQHATEELHDYRARLTRQREFASLIAMQRSLLRELYSAPVTPAEIRERKAAAYQRMGREYESLKSRWGGVGAYDGWFIDGFNNAKLVALTSYQRWVPGLRRRLEAVGPEAFYEELQSLLELDDASRAAALTSWNLASETAAVANERELVRSPAEVVDHDRLHSFRHDVKRGESVVATDTRDGQRAVVVPAEQFAR